MRAIVTGGASGIGRAIVQRLRAEDSEVLVLDLTGGFDVADPRAWEDVPPVELAFLNAVADIALLAARSNLTGQAWLCLPGRTAELFAFPEL